MTRRLRSILALMLALALACASSALAGPIRGKTYEGRAPSSGVDREGHRQHTHATGNVVLRVAGNGKSVTVRFSASSPILYCVTQQQLHVQSTKPALISSNGKFTATIAQRFAAGPGAPSIVQVITGQFSGHTVKGKISTHASECSGVSYFSATAH